MIVSIEPREMIYLQERKIQLLYSNIYLGYRYYILNLGTHPTAYVEISKENFLYKIRYIDIEDINVHGGLTYSDTDLRIGENITLMNSWFIGWDYAHSGDYIDGLVVCNKGKKWTTLEIIEECKNVIEQIKEMEN